MPNFTNRMSFISWQVLFPEAELILKTFTFAPYCYPYAPPSTVTSAQLSTLNLRPPSHSNTLALQIHAVPASTPTGSSTLFENEKNIGPFTRIAKSRQAKSLMPSAPVTWSQQR